jgi:pre-rRNA-processing protein TSR3
MLYFPPTIILRHRRENLKKCTLRGLEKRDDFLFFTYPQDSLPDLSSHVLLSLDAPPLSIADRSYGVFLIDATWRYAAKISKQVSPVSPILRSLPPFYQTAYPRRQEDCPERGLASIEALFVAYLILGRDPSHLLDTYHWKDLFLEKNHDHLNPLHRQLDPLQL